MKALKKITAFIGIIIFGIGSFYLGSIYNSPKENNQQEVITQNLIAVVNADEGVYIDGKTDLWREKQKYKFDRAKRGYSEYGSLNYPWMVSLAGDLDVLNPLNFGLFERGWKSIMPEKCEQGE